MNFSKFLITTYEPVHDDDTKGMMHFHLAFLLRKLCSGDPKQMLLSKRVSVADSVSGANDLPTNGVAAAANGTSAASTSTGLSHSFTLNDLLTEVDDSDHSMLSRIGSAFTECYLTESALPVTDLLFACFRLTCDRDIELDIDWLDAMYSEDEEESATNAATNAVAIDAAIRDAANQSLEEFMAQQFGARSADRDDNNRESRTDNDNDNDRSNGKPVFSAISLESPSLKHAHTSLAEVVTSSSQAAMAAGKTGEHLAEAIKLAVNQKLNL